jgi:Rieske Fe-S protein
MSMSRREILATTAVTVTLPMLGAALRSAQAAATGAAPAPGRGAAARATPDEPAGWITTTIKPADVKDGEFTDVPGHALALTRTGKDISAISTKCTHQGCKIPPKAGQKTLVCPCHGGTFNLDGSVAKAPPKNPLPIFAIRTSDAGVIEIDPGQKPAKEDKLYKITVA